VRLSYLFLLAVALQFQALGATIGDIPRTLDLVDRTQPGELTLNSDYSAVAADELDGNSAFDLTSNQANGLFVDPILTAVLRSGLWNDPRAEPGGTAGSLALNTLFGASLKLHLDAELGAAGGEHTACSISLPAAVYSELVEVVAFRS